MSNAFYIVRALFPKSRIFKLIYNSALKKLVKAVSALPEDIRREVELVYSDQFPETTRCLGKWETVFGVLATKIQETQRRSVLNALWKSAGGQSAAWLQYLLSQIVSDINVVENVPLRNPLNANIATVSINGNEIMNNANEKAINNYRVGDESFIPTVLENGTSEEYNIPDDSFYWESCFFICGGVSRNSRNEILYIEKIVIDEIWKSYFEYLILKNMPRHMRAVLYVKWES